MSNRHEAHVLRWLAAVVFLWAFPLRGEEDFSRGMLDRDRALAAAREVSTNRYPDADDVLVDGVERYRYEADGTYTEWHEEYVKVLTEAGRRNYRTLTSHFTIPYQRGPEDCKITLVETVKPDGRAVPVDVAGQSRIMIDPSAMGANIYNPNDKVLAVSVAGLEVGDVLHFVFFDRIVQPRMRDTWCDWFVLENTRPAVRNVIQIDAPKARPLLRIMVKDEIKGTVTSETKEEGDRIRYRWEAREVPRMFPEPDMPALHTVVQRLIVSSVPDWETVSRWYWGLSEPHYASTPAMQAEVDRLTAGIGDRRKKIEAVFQFVSQQVRYMGITVEAAAPGYEPHDVKDTFEARHGVCRDKAALLVVMLRLAGFEAFPTLINVGPKMDTEAPVPYFNHAIAAVREPDGTYLLMDPTDETTTRLLPSYLDDLSYLVATPAGDPLRTSPIDPADNNLMRIVTTGHVTESGGLVAETVLQYDGINDNAYRGRFARQTPEDRRRYFEDLLMRAIPGTRLCSLELQPLDMMNVAQPLTARLAYEVDDVLVAGRGTAALTLPVLGPHLGVVNAVIGQTGLKQRKYPLVTEMACGLKESVSVQLSEALGTPLSLPRAESVDSDLLTWRLSSEVTNRTLTASAEFKLKGVEFKPNQYAQLKDMLRRMEQDRRRMPLFALGAGWRRPHADDADAVVLDDAVTYTVRDARSWTEDRTVRKQILSYAGKKQNSEIKIAFNPVWEEVEMKEAVVTNLDGTAKSIRPQEVNVMDADWVGAAPRYPGGKLLVVSLPAVEIGSVIRFRYVRTRRDQPFLALRETFRSFDEIRRKSVTLDVPARLRVKTGVRNDADGTVKTECRDGARGRKVYQWSAENVPQARREDMLPPWWSFNPTVWASTGDWEEYAGDLSATLRKMAARQRKAEAKARELVATLTDPTRRMEAIRDFLAIQIREVGPALNELPLAALTPADRTLTDGYGNTADRAVLLSVMLKAAGFDTEFVLVSPDSFVPAVTDPGREFPAASLFPRVLVRARDPSGAGGADVYLGDTDQYAALGATPHTGKCGLVLPSGEWQQIDPPRPDYTVVDWTIALDENGGARMTRKELVYGNAYAAENRRFAEMTPEKRRREFQEMAGAVSQAAEAEGDLTTDFSGYPGIIEFTVRVPKYGVRDGEFLYVALPRQLDGILDTKSDTRENPMLFAAPAHRKVRVRLQVPPGFRVDHLPEALPRTSVPGTGIDVVVGVSGAAEGGGNIAVEAEASVLPCVVSAGNYGEVLKLSQSLAHRRLRMVVLRKAQ